MPARGSINLLPKDTSNTKLDKILQWSLSFGRYVVIVTELVVMGAFLARFGLDQKLSDLYDSIKQKQIFIDSYNDFESQFRLTQNKLVTIEQASAEQLNISVMLETISKLIPTSTVNLSALSFAGSEIKIVGVAQSESSLGVLVRSLRDEKRLSNISVLSISSSQANQGVDFTISMSWNKI
jgi:Tfp pilus assembly protein PilN